MRIDNDTKRIFVSQSWLKDMLLCPERARFSVVMPELRTTNDSAAIGTSVHAGIEAVLSGKLAGQSFDAIETIAVAKLNELRSQGIQHTNVPEEYWEKHVIGLSRAWLKDIYPHVDTQGGQTELYFEVPTKQMVSTPGGAYEMWFEGTIDYAQASGLWDWKTSARKYSLLEKQSQDIQSAIYCYAGGQLGIVGADSTFKFGVLIRTDNPYGQIVEVERTAGHSDFVIQQARAAVVSVLAMTEHAGAMLDEHWLINDQHYLCSQRWCPWWNECKGAMINQTTNAEEAN